MVLVEHFTPDLVAEMKRECTVTTTVLPAFKNFQKPKVYPLYYLSADRKALYLPRYYAIEKLGPPDYVALSSGRKINVPFPAQPLPHQLAAIEKLDALYNDDSQLGGGGVLSLPCGYGKTFCAIRTICRLGLSALIIVPTECLMDQWMDAIKQFAPSASLGYIQRDHVDVNGKDIVVAMLHSLSLKDYPPSTFDQFGITIYDECHHLGSEYFSKSMKKIRTKFTLGLSATPIRRDGLSPVFFHFLGPLLHKERRSGSNVVIIKKFDLYSSSSHYEVLRDQSGNKKTPCMITAISKFEERNRLIVSIFRELIGQGRRILLLSSRKQHLHDLKDMLDAAGIRRPSDGRYATYGFYYGKTGMTREKHKIMRNESAKCDIVLGISNLAQEGLDIPDRNTLVWSTPPGTEIEQPVGRILRKFHKDLHPIVIDLVDHTGNFVTQSRARDKWFREEGYVIQRCRVNLEAHKAGGEKAGLAEWHNNVLAYINQIPSDKEMAAKIEAGAGDDEDDESDDGEAQVPGPDLDFCMLGGDDNEDDGDGDSEGGKRAASAMAIARATKSAEIKARATAKAKAIAKAKADAKADPLNQCLIRDMTPAAKAATKAQRKPKEPIFDRCLV